MRHTWLVIIPLVSLALLACAQTSTGSGMTQMGLQRYHITVDGVPRSFYMRAASDVTTNTRKPVLLVLHGGGKGDGLSVARYLGFSQTAEPDGALVVYPNGVDAYWRDGRGYTHRGKSDTKVDDVSFISSLIDFLVAQHGADPKRVYVTGISNGGMMSFRLGCELSDKLAAIAPVAANMPQNLTESCTPAHNVPLLLMNGTDDPMVPYYGGYVGFMRKKMGRVMSSQESIDFWRNMNQCRGLPVVEYLPDVNQDDHSKIRVERYSDSESNCSVVLYVVENGGHTLPGSNTPDLPGLLGHKNQDIDGAGVIWAFLKCHTR